ncbi:hypothetical protein [Pseudomonas putida]|uniref:Uncharacterized protein n=1 Tax=Pseudomonas putida TaxID=303 RepID=A0A1Q9QUG7_PSEPU|nr:hypothetical protein [Pseudomonas putida]OLS58803.1 hypothetical protein PSEMO_61640 [Pseudomonas putida]
MSQMRKVVAIVRNYQERISGESAARYTRVRLEDESGKTYYIKRLVVPDYLARKGAFSNDVSRTWYVKSVDKHTVVIVGYEDSFGKFFYDLDEVKTLSKGAKVQGFIYAIAAVPAPIIVAVATYGLGLLLMPLFVYQAYKFLFKVPSILSQATLKKDFQNFGISI